MRAIAALNSDSASIRSSLLSGLANLIWTYPLSLNYGSPSSIGVFPYYLAVSTPPPPQMWFYSLISGQVLLKSFHRSVRTRNATLVVAPLLNQLTDAVREIVRPALLRRLNLSGPAEPTNSDFLVASNSLECAAYYCRKLRDVVAADFAEHFASLTPLAEVALGELEALASLFESHASDAIEQLAASLMPTGWLLIEFADMDFRIGNGGDAAENALRSAFDEKLLAPLGVALSSLVVRLRSTNGQTLVRQLSTALASQIERAAFQVRPLCPFCAYPGSLLVVYSISWALSSAHQVRRYRRSVSMRLAPCSLANRCDG